MSIIQDYTTVSFHFVEISQPTLGFYSIFSSKIMN